MTIDEQALTFSCGDDCLYGILSPVAGPCARGVLIVVGGPQYRVGSNRQFTLLARSLARQGIAAMRFDYRGMGDSQGEPRTFDSVDDDLRAAIDAFMLAVPGMREVVLWGLCDAASAATMYAASDPRVSGLVLLNPWVRTADGLAKTTLRHYYRDRLFDHVFWRQLLRGQLDYRRSLKSIVKLTRDAFAVPSAEQASKGNLPDRMHTGMREFQGRVLIIISGADLTGREFCDLTAATDKWKRLLDSPKVLQRRLDKADHTFSRRAWRDEVAQWTSSWLRSW
ncbi:MAG: hydrolase 1, exosortase system-associated [Massilia sp.]|nr:hydrolase 1, exosortase system-associated [Massilia sp.]